MKLTLVCGALAAAVLTGCNMKPVDYCNGNIAEDNAFYLSQQFIAETLKAPASARHPNRNAPGVSVRKAGECKFTVLSYVDSQNSFGAMLRLNYLMTITVNRSTGSATMDSLTTSER